MPSDEVKRSFGPSLLFQKTCGYFDESLPIKWGIGVLFVLALFLSLHFREVRVETLELDTPAKKYVVAQTNFEFLDHDATKLQRLDAVRDLGKIYRLSEREIRQRIKDIENDFAENDELKKELPDASLSELHFTMDTFQRGIRSLHFTDQRTLEMLKKRNVDVSQFEPLESLQGQSTLFLPTYIWQQEADRIFQEHPVPKSFSNFVVSEFSKKPWKLEEDTVLVRKIRYEIESEVKEQYTSIGAGDRIIDQGDRVMNRHVTMLLAMKRQLNESRNLWAPTTILGSLILAILITFVSASFFYTNYPKIFRSNRQLFLLTTLSIIPLILSRAFDLWQLNSDGRLHEWLSYPLFVPLAAILTCHLMGPKIATFTAVLITVTLTISETLDLQGMLINIVASLIAILETKSLKHRKEIFVVSFKAFLGCIWVIVAFHLYENTVFDISILADLFSAFVFLLGTSVIVLGLLPLFETTFQVVTDVTLMEYLDPSHPLLRRLSMEAPGTYQHSLVVGTLAEAAALAIGANGLFCRVATLYHDIGKMVMPHYFTENQMGEMNVHKLLTPTESAQAIISHVTEGVAMARKAGLPEPFIDIIKEHHGTSLVWYFYKGYLDQMGLEVGEGDVSLFRYAGPKPQSREAAIIMLADGIEAASRSLDRLDEANLSCLMDQIIETKQKDHQFDECPLSFEEMAIVKKTMVQTLVAASHVRIKYPKEVASAT